ncbi:hypothetical protein ACJJTC_011021 [Scirpophaga incertulas]
MKKHEAYTEWADAYSCSRHRCQPGGRSLAMYTVGCKRVEAPESAIECEEVVEDTNMQFPYCCTRLRCLVVIKGEVWTQVLGQPWEALPAAPWSHMYKMKKPPPGESFLPNRSTTQQGPVYELLSDRETEKVLRSSKGKGDHDCNEGTLRAVPAPDIVIALTTNDDKDQKRNELKSDNKSHKQQTDPIYEEDVASLNEVDAEEHVTAKAKHQLASWTKIAPNDWSDHEANLQEEPLVRGSQAPEPEEEKTEDSSTHLQALVDAIGSRMRDIENVVQQMNEKVQQAKPDADIANKKYSTETDIDERKQKKLEDHPNSKLPNPIKDNNYKRFSVLKRGSKYLRSLIDYSTELPLIIEDNKNGYFSDASNTILRRANILKEPAAVYMAPVENHHKSRNHVSDTSNESDKKHKKHSHKKRKNRGKGHKKHKKDSKKHRVSSVEIEKNIVSLEDSHEQAKVSK